MSTISRLPSARCYVGVAGAMRHRDGHDFLVLAAEAESLRVIMRDYLSEEPDMERCKPAILTGTPADLLEASR
jgi:hypothetical protein